MSFFAGILIFVLVVNCALLILLVLMQLPKKDAGAGLAFGGGAADALFGAGSGNFLTQATKYSIIVFCLLSLLLGWMENKISNDTNASEFMKAVQQKQMQMPVAPPSSTTPSTAPPMSPPAAPAAGGLVPPPVTPPSGTNSTAAPAK